jgi:hypothetical protein
MTDLLDRPAAPEQEPDLRRAHADARPSSSPRPGADQWFLAALLIGAGAIHVAMAPSHLNESVVEGAGFVAAAWVQVALGVAVLLGPPSRRLLVAVAGTGIVLIAVWLLSRTAGLPLGAHTGHAESVSIVDGICVGLEAVAVLTAVAGLTGLASGLLRARGVAVLGALAVAFATAAVASPAARDHAAHSHGTRGAQSRRATTMATPPAPLAATTSASRRSPTATSTSTATSR